MKDSFSFQNLPHFKCFLLLPLEPSKIFLVRQPFHNLLEENPKRTMSVSSYLCLKTKETVENKTLGHAKVQAQIILQTTYRQGDRKKKGLIKIRTLLSMMKKGGFVSLFILQYKAE